MKIVLKSEIEIAMRYVSMWKNKFGIDYLVLNTPSQKAIRLASFPAQH